MTPPVPDGPDTELAAAEAWFREDPKRLDFAPITEWSRHLRTIVRAYLARPDGAPQHLVRGDRVETADGVRATVTGPAPRGPNGEPAVNLDWDGDTGGPAYEHDLRRVVDARPAAGRDLTGVEDGPSAVELLDDNERLGARIATLNSELKVPPRAAARIAQARADQTEGYGSTTSTVEGLLRELDRRGGELVRLRAACARPAVARTDGQPPADPVQITRDPARVTAQVVQAVWDEEGPEGVADWIRDMTADPAAVTAAATAPWMVESRDERVDRLTRHVENVADCAGIEIEVREAGPLTGPAPLRRLVRALEGAGMLHDDPADDTAAPDLPTLRCDRCDATAGPGYPPMGEPFVYFVRPGLCHPCSLADSGQPVRGSQGRES